MISWVRIKQERYTKSLTTLLHSYKLSIVLPHRGNMQVERSLCNRLLGDKLWVRRGHVKKKKRPTAELIGKCKELCREIIKIRAQNRCERCGKTTNLQWAHIVPQNKCRALILNTDNAMCLCAGCHLWWHNDAPILVGRWFDHRWPGRYDRLQYLRTIKFRLPVQDTYDDLLRQLLTLKRASATVMGKEE